MVATQSPGPDVKASTETLGVLPAGTILHGFEVASVLGHGGFGITYLARDTKLDREVAIKEYLPTSLALRHGGTTVMPRSTELADDFVWGRERFLDEARTLAKLEGTPAVVRVIDFLEENGTAYTVMALAKGQTLERIVKQKGPLPAPAIERLLDALLDGIERVHKAGFLHRDIKPANIIVDDDGNPTLIDFGASRAAIAGHTAAMTAIFTPGYAAAEQFTSAKQGPWTDIYGLSATLYNAITGKVPPSAFDRMLDDAYEPIVRLAPPGFPPSLLAGIDAGLAVKAGDRPQSIADWRAMIHLAEGPVRANEVTAFMRKPRPPAAPAASSLPAAPSLAARWKPRRWMIAAMVLLIIFASSHKGRSLLFGEQPLGPTPAEQAQLAKQHLEEIAAKAEADAKAAEAEAKARAKADEAEAKAKADAAAQAKAAADAKAKADADAAAARASAETAETALRLSIQDRQRLQIALTSLGFDTKGTDGTFGQRTRDMISAWQTAHGQPATGFLNALQEQAMLSEGAPAVKKFDDEQKGAEEAAKPKPAVAAAPAPPAVVAQSQPPVPAPASTPTPPAAPTATTTAFDGVWTVNLVCPNYADAKGFTYQFNLTVTNGIAQGQHGSEGVPGFLAISGRIAADGTTTMTARGLVGDSKTAVGGLSSGSMVVYRFPASFSGNRGTGNRTMYRPCTYTFTKQ